MLFTAAVATAQSYVAAPSYSKNATDGDWRQPAPLAGNALAANTLTGRTLAAPALCLAAVQAAEYRHGIPRGLLLAIAEVETGRPLAEGGGRVPWPWSANADNQSYFFATRQDAVAWTTQALRHGTASIDSGCMQVNLAQHPDAFASVDEAFDPARNADYAARFLIQLYRETGDWRVAVGWYHSHTPTLAEPYRDRVAAAFAEAVMHRRAQILVEMAAAWGATRTGPSAACPTSSAPNDAIGSAALQFANSCGVH